MRIYKACNIPILHVIGLRAQVQMPRINAQFYIASMKNLLASGIDFMLDKVRNPRSNIRLTVEAYNAYGVAVEGLCTGSPKPTKIICLSINFTPEIEFLVPR